MTDPNELFDDVLSEFYYDGKTAEIDLAELVEEDDYVDFCPRCDEGSYHILHYNRPCEFCGFPNLLSKED